MVPMDVSRKSKTVTPPVTPLNLTRSVVRRTNTVYVGHSPICRDITHARPSTQQYNNVAAPAIGNRNGFDLRQDYSALFSPKYYQNYLSIPEVVSKIGAKTTYKEISGAAYNLFDATGDVTFIWISRRLTVINACSIGRTNVAPSALRAGEFGIEDSDLGKQARMIISSLLPAENPHSTLRLVTLTSSTYSSIALSGHCCS